MNIWHDISADRVTPEKFTAVIEISKGGKNKYELDKSTGLLRLDRVLYTSTHYPANYGFIPRTYADDKDPLDVLVLCQESIIPLTLVDCKPIGVLEMTDGESFDEKIIAVPLRDPSYNCFESILQLPKHIFEEVSNFFEVYKTLEGIPTEVKDIKGADEAVKIIDMCINNYKEAFSN
ncbi:MAG: inorganic diphosphatase [Acutalibacteraceae bacterium]